MSHGKSKLKKGKKKKAYTFEQLQNFFLGVWKEREDEHGCVRCYESGKLLCGDQKYNISNFHHILLKSQYPQYTFTKKNICIISQDIHSQVHADISKTPKVQDLTNKIFELHKKDEL